MFTAMGRAIGPGTTWFLHDVREAPADWVQQTTSRDIARNAEWSIDAGRNGWFTGSVDNHAAVKAGCDIYGAVSTNIAAPRFSSVQEKFFVARPNDDWTRPERRTSVGVSPFTPSSSQRASIEKLLTEELARTLPGRRKDLEFMLRDDNRRTWQRLYDRIALGQATIGYDVQAFRLTPDGDPRLFVRARWHMDNRPVYLLGAWIRSGATMTVESADARAAQNLWFGSESGPSGLDASGQILNVLDTDRDGFAEILMMRHGYESTQILLARYPFSRDGEPTIVVAFNSGC